MKPFLISVVLITTNLTQAEQTNTLTQSRNDVLTRVIGASRTMHPLLVDGGPLLLGGEDCKTPVLFMEPLQSQSLQELLPSFTVYRLVSSRDIIHRAHCSALLLYTNGCPSHLRSDKEVTVFLGSLSEKVRGKDDALRLVRAFADLRSYRIIETSPDFPDVRKREDQPTPAETDYKFVAEERSDQWHVYATFLTSEYSGACERYVFTIWKPPGGGILLSDPVLIRLRNYVY